MLKATPRRVAPIIAVIVALSVGGVGLAQADSHPSAHAAKGKKKRHVLNADYKSGPLGIDNETDNTLQSDDEARLVGRPFGAKKAHLEEISLITYSNPGNDFSGTNQITFKALVYGHGGFKGSYSYSQDANGNPSSAITGTITGGGGEYRGAKGSFTVTNLVPFHPEQVQYRAHWQGFIRY
jgi:hypothetical protein